jgi:peptidoglycan/xylan/chitin deacetylase (PgdA/CDA1 family)
MTPTDVTVTHLNGDTIELNSLGHSVDHRQVRVTGRASVRGIDLMDMGPPTWTPNGNGWTGRWTADNGEEVIDTVNDEGFRRHYVTMNATFFTPIENVDVGALYEAIIASYLSQEKILA